MRTFTISGFKAHALSIIQAVAETGERIVVTKRGKPLVYVTPYADPERTATLGKLSGTISFEGDIVSPLRSLPHGEQKASGQGSKGAAQ